MALRQRLGRPLATQYFSRTSGPASFFNRNAAEFFTPEFWPALQRSRRRNSSASLTAMVKDEPLLNQMLYVDSKTWLPDDLLVKADKITMANSLELRVPLSDHKVLEFAASLPPDFKVRGKETKRHFEGDLCRNRCRKKSSNGRRLAFPCRRIVVAWRTEEQVEGVLLSDPLFVARLFRKAEVSRLLEANSLDNSSEGGFCLLILELWHRQFADAPALPSRDMAETGTRSTFSSLEKEAGAAMLDSATCP